MWIERAVLEYERRAAFMRRRALHVDTIEVNGSDRRRFQAGDQPKGRGLPAARRADEGKQFSVEDFQVEMVNGAMSGAPQNVVFAHPL